uniref:Carboxypeptidase n=1 Tax=Trichobilharzia regenti TaxID=157069 RepID=A0AA85J5T8_TRIRE|nr:unnamed protein product [Trichobilharzia regenti]
MIYRVFIVLFTIWFCDSRVISTNSKEDDRIVDLPGVDTPPIFKQYSGYLSGADDNIQLHYWLVESSFDPEAAPLLLWLNGGPGCSSLEGLVSENGPYKLVKGPKLVENQFSWNKFANVLYLEAPAGVGFSYSINGSLHTDDDITSENNFYALLNFLKKFPEYEKRDFYIAGESYAGVYVPTLALRVINSDKFNLKGIAVGNGYVHDEFLDNSALYFAYYHGLVDEDQWNTLLTQCCQVGYPTKCLFTRNASDFCDAIIGQIAGSVMTEMNIYNIYSECEGGITPHHPTSSDKHSDFGNLFRKNKYMQEHRQLLRTMGRKLQTRLAIPCLNDSTIRGYFNSSDVRKAIHVREDIPVEWDICSQEVNFGYTRQYTDLSSQYTQLLQSGVNILIYNGDTDMACNYIGDEWFVDNLNLPVEMNRTSWYYTEVDGTQQVGGYWKGYKLHKSLLVYTTIHGAGHMVPQDKPVAAYSMMSIFVQAA